MFRVHPVTSLDLPALAPYRTMRRQAEQRAQGIFVAESEKVVRRLLTSDLRVVSLLLPERWLHALAPLLERRAEEIEVYVAEKALLEQLTGFSMYQGVLAIGQVPPPLPLETVLGRQPRPYLLAAVDGLANAENLGGLVRNCVAFGVQGLLVGETSSSPFLRRAVRGSMGGIFRLPVIETARLVQALGDLRGRGIRCVAADPHRHRSELTQADLRADCCLVFGSEGQGLSPEVRATCDEVVAIPMAPGVDSLNVGSAAAVFLFEAYRQRRAAGIPGPPPTA
jgi:tRNA G18 (ribose-2'-O)-methylase SpoU